MRHGPVLVTVVCTAALALASGCGGGGGTKYSGTSPDTWAATVCGALGDWAEGVKTDSETFGTQVGNNSGNLPAVKAKLVIFLEHGEKRSRTMAAKVRSAGPPAVKDGAAIQRDLEGVLGEAEQTFIRAVARAKKLPTRDPQALANGLRNLGSSVQKELSITGRQFQQLGDKYDSDRLDKATSEAPACKKLTGSG